MLALFRIFRLPTCRVFSWKRIPMLPRMMLFTLSGNLSKKDVKNKCGSKRKKKKI